MSYFYGTAQGDGGQAVRTAGISSSIRTNTACWSGTIWTRLSHDKDTGNDRVTIEIRDWPHDRGHSAIIFRGTMQALTEAAKAGTLRPAAISNTYDVAIATHDIVDPETGEVVAEQWQVLSDEAIERIQALPIEPPYHCHDSIGRASFVNQTAFVFATRASADGLRFVVA